MICYFSEIEFEFLTNQIRANLSDLELAITLLPGSASCRPRQGNTESGYRLSLLRVASSTQDLGDHVEQRHVGATSGIGRCETSWGYIATDGIIHCALFADREQKTYKKQFFFAKV